MYTIGKFSTICDLPVKTLRYYDDIGLLKPSYIDSETNYRYYDYEKIEVIKIILLLKSLHIPLADIKQIIKSTNQVQWAKKKDLLNSAILLAIPQDNPKTTLPENCRFDACIVISKDYQLNDPVCESELSGGKYLTFEVKHTAEDIQKAYTDIFPTLERNGYQVDHKPIFERYTGDMINNPYCEICVPVKPL